MAVSRSKDVEVFGPPIKEGAIFPKGKVFAEFLLAKVVNAENAAHRSEKFVTMATRTRQEYLKDLVTNYSTSTPVDTGQKFCKFIICKFLFYFDFLVCLFYVHALFLFLFCNNINKPRELWLRIHIIFYDCLKILKTIKKRLKKLYLEDTIEEL